MKILFSEKNLLDGNEESLTHDRFPNDLTLRYKSSSLYIFPPLHQNQNFVLFTCRYVCIICNVSYQAALNGGKRRCSTSSERETNLFLRFIGVTGIFFGIQRISEILATHYTKYNNLMSTVKVELISFASMKQSYCKLRHFLEKKITPQ